MSVCFSRARMKFSDTSSVHEFYKLFIEAALLTHHYTPTVIVPQADVLILRGLRTCIQYARLDRNLCSSLASPFPFVPRIYRLISWATFILEKTHLIFIWSYFKLIIFPSFHFSQVRPTVVHFVSYWRHRPAQWPQLPDETLCRLEIHVWYSKALRGRHRRIVVLRNSIQQFFPKLRVVLK